MIEFTNKRSKRKKPRTPEQLEARRKQAERRYKRERIKRNWERAELYELQVAEANKIIAKREVFITKVKNLPEIQSLSKRKQEEVIQTLLFKYLGPPEEPKLFKFKQTSLPAYEPIDPPKEE